MTAHIVSPLLILLPVAALFSAFITCATAEGLDVDSLPKDLKDLGPVKDEAMKSNIIDQINGPAGAPKTGDPAATTIANALSSAPAPGGGNSDKLKSIVQQFESGPSPAADAVKNGDASALTSMFKLAPSPGGIADGATAALNQLPPGAADALSDILKGGSPSGSGSGDKEQAPHSDEDSGSPSHGASSFLGVAMLMGLLSFFSSQ